VQTGSTIICPHGGPVSGIPSNMRVLLNGRPALTQTDTFIVVGCPIRHHPCVLARWITASLRIRISGRPVLLQTSTGICQAPDQAPQGPPNVIVTQMRASGE
jgi:PAAR motif